MQDAAWNDFDYGSVNQESLKYLEWEPFTELLGTSSPQTRKRYNLWGYSIFTVAI
jgi:hypothetical protein